MIKKEYMQPWIEVLKADAEAQILADSLAGVITDLGEDELSLPTDDELITSIIWGNAM